MRNVAILKKWGHKTQHETRQNFFKFFSRYANLNCNSIFGIWLLLNALSTKVYAYTHTHTFYVTLLKLPVFYPTWLLKYIKITLLCPHVCPWHVSGKNHQNIMDTWRVPYALPCLTRINKSLGVSMFHRLFLTPLHRSQYWSIPRTYLSAKLVPKSIVASTIQDCKLSFVEIVNKFASEPGKGLCITNESFE